jgi:hypothetical protein
MDGRVFFGMPGLFFSRTTQPAPQQVCAGIGTLVFIVPGWPAS